MLPIATRGIKGKKSLETPRMGNVLLTLFGALGVGDLVAGEGKVTTREE